MNILLVSECSGRALNQTRRILDQFAERRGERTWQTPITKAGLDTLRGLLRKSARKNTSVACHWIRGLNHSELLWVVGDRRRFNAEGTVPTNRTSRDVLRSADENDWHTGEDISLLAQLAALLHDLGKASVAFQKRLQGKLLEQNLYRHEWVSLRLFLAFVGDDDDATWLQRLAAPTPADDASWLADGRYWRDGLDTAAPKPFARLPPLAAAVAWLVLTHHRLLTLPVDAQTEHGWFGRRSHNFSPNDLDMLWQRVDAEWNDYNTQRKQADAGALSGYWAMAGALPVTLPKWRERASKLATRLLALHAKPGKGDWLANPYVMHIARMGLMLADHHYSSLSAGSSDRVQGDDGYALFANTERKTGAMKQPLDEHLLGVARNTAMLCRNLPGFSRHLSTFQHRNLRKRSTEGAFRWQDKAFDAAEGIRDKAAEHGAFIVNMASTGRGKTFANARIMYALADAQHGMRCSFAVGMRTLTLQMGRNYRDILGVGEDELAVRVGGSASRQLFEYHEALAEASGSASTQALMEEDGAVSFDGNIDAHPLLRMAMGDQHIKKLLSAPLLVCTIDHLMPATEAQRAGRQIAPMLRLMSGDLVLDEPDDFDIADLPALARLVHWAGLLGSRVLLSSATLPPALVHGLFDAYRSGRRHYQHNRGDGGGQPLPDAAIPCLWVDEFKAVSHDCVDRAAFESAHAGFVQARVEKLGKQESPKQLGELRSLAISAKDEPGIRREFAANVRQAALEMHGRHFEVDAQSGKRVSFGLVRMANIAPLYDVAQSLFRLGAPEGVRIHLCVYHSRFPLLMRSAIEKSLDSALHCKSGRGYALPQVRQALDSGDERDHLFVVLASPVAEVGRDHDYDWAVVEPSSMRSLIQLAGRVRRHRSAGNGQPNVAIFRHNIKHFEQGGRLDRPVFVRPGFEELNPPIKTPGGRGALRFAAHDLQELLRDDEWASIDARPRIQRDMSPDPLHRWVDLEHLRLNIVMRGSPSDALCAASFWNAPNAHLTWALPQQQPFRDDSGRNEQTLVWLPNDDEDALLLHRVDDKRLRKAEPGAYTEAEGSKAMVPLHAQMGPGIAPWMQFDMLDLLRPLAEAQGMSLDEAAKRFTVVQVPAPSPNQLARWRWHPVLGMELQR
ncbi:MAG: type I-F CRISPR-associated helicase Cas3f [Pseudomonadota bacterium]|nr:type I-F CRISPR-associated helicase Cas3f [Pseudomonadota bacterium]